MSEEDLRRLRNNIVIRPHPGGVLIHPCGCRMTSAVADDGSGNLVYPTHIRVHPDCERHQHLLNPPIVGPEA